MKRLGVPLALAAVTCCAVAACAVAQQHTLAADISSMHPACSLNMNEASGSFHDAASGLDWPALGPGTVLYRQAGFDITNVKDYAAAVPYNASVKAPNNALCDLDWNQPWTIHVQIHGLNFLRTNYHQQEIITKGTFPGASSVGVKYDDAGGAGWSLFLTWAGYTQACFALTARANGGGWTQVCSSKGSGEAPEDMDNGFRYAMTIQNDGLGKADSVTLHMNGSVIGSTTGNLGTSMSTPETCPVMLSGDCGNALMAAGAKIVTAAPIVYDQVAIFRRKLTETEVQQLWIDSKFYQDVLGAPPVAPRLAIQDNDGTADTDNLWAYTALLRAHQLGYVTLLGYNNTTASVSDPAVYRALNGLAGLGHIPVSQSSTNTYVTSLGNAIAGYTPNVPPMTAYPSDVIGIHTMLAAVPAGQQAIYLLGGSHDSLQRVLQNDAALFKTKVSAVYAQGGNDATSNATYTPNYGFGNEAICPACGAYVFANLSRPLYLKGDTKSQSGPYTELTRGAKDPFSLVLGAQIALTPGSITFRRYVWDSLPVAYLLAPSLFAIASRGYYSIYLGNGFKTWTVDPSGTMFNLTLARSNVNIYGWFVNSLTGLRAQLPYRRM